MAKMRWHYGGICSGDISPCNISSDIIPSVETRPSSGISACPVVTMLFPTFIVSTNSLLGSKKRQAGEFYLPQEELKRSHPTERLCHGTPLGSEVQL